MGVQLRQKYQVQRHATDALLFPLFFSILRIASWKAFRDHELKADEYKQTIANYIATRITILFVPSGNSSLHYCNIVRLISNKVERNDLFLLILQ